MSETTKLQSEIADQLFGFASQIVGDLRDVEAAQDEAKAARDVASKANDSVNSNKKIGILTAAAKLSNDNQWSLEDIKAALAVARERNFQGINKKPTSLNTFYSNVGLACAPSVRAHFPIIVKAVTEAWNAENDYDEGAERPVQSFGSKRLGALIIGVATAMRNGATKKNDPKWPPVKITKADDVVAYVDARNPKTDALKAADKCKALANQVEAMNAEFHYELLAEVVKHLRQESMGERLVAARDMFHAKAEANKTARLVKANGKANGATPKPADVLKPEAPMSKAELARAAIAAAKATTPTPKPAITAADLSANIDELMDDNEDDSEDDSED